MKQAPTTGNPRRNNTAWPNCPRHCRSLSEVRDLLNAATIEQLLHWSSEPGLLPRVPSGPDRGKSWDRLGMEALQDCLRDRDADVRFSAQIEMARRGATGSPDSDEPEQGSFL